MYDVDKKTRKLGNKICEELKDILNKNVTNGFLIGGDSADFLFYIHDNKYDYKQICIKQLKDLLTDEDFDEVEFYTACVLKNLKEENFDIHISTAEERFIVDELEEYGCKDLHIFEGELHGRCDFSEGIYISDITTLDYNKSEGGIYIETNDDEKFYVDLRDESITWLNEDDNEDKGGCLNWSDIPNEIKEYLFADKSFKDNSFCSKQGTIFVRNKLIKKYMYVLADDRA